MTKALTEQWRKGKLPEDTYYVQFICGRYGVYEFEKYKGFGFDNDLAYIKEVLAPVPSYDEYKELTQRVGRLELDNEVLEDVVQECNKRGLENKKLQEQLKEAREVVKFYAETTVGHKQKDGTYGMWVCSGEVAWENPLDRIKKRMDYICYDPRPAKDYLEKWGVK